MTLELLSCEQETSTSTARLYAMHRTVFRFFYLAFSARNIPIILFLTF